MMNKKTFTAILKGTIFAMAMLLVTIAADAQGQLRYQTRYSKSDVSRTITRLENSSNKFRNDFDKAMDNSRRNGSNAEDRYNDNVRDFENSIDHLRRDFDRTNSWWETRNQTSDVIREAQVVNNMMNAISFRRKLESQWNKMRNDLNTLADTYDLPGLNGGGYNGGNNGGGWNGGNNGGGWNGSGNMSSPPSWAQGTFYSTSGENITVTMDRQGRVTVINGGQTYYGTYNRGNLLLNGDSSAVTKSGNNGFRTYNRNTGQYTTYSRDRNGGNNGGGWNGGGNTSNPPNWARGTFYNNDGNIQLSIADNGQVTANVGGQTYYGNYNNGQLTLNGDTSTVQKDGNGIKTYNQSTGQWTSYRRN